MNVGSGAAEPVGSVEVALAHALDLLNSRPALALEQAHEILKSVPGHPIATLVVGMAQRLLGDVSAALATLEPLARNQPTAGAVHYQPVLVVHCTGGWPRRGCSQSTSPRSRAEPRAARGVAGVGGSLERDGRQRGGGCRLRAPHQGGTRDPRLLRPAAALVDNDIPTAESLLRAHLRQYPTDVAALRMLAEVAGRLGRYPDAETLLERCLELSPGFVEARANYATVLNRQNRASDALAQVNQVLAADPNNFNHRTLKANVLVNIGEYSQAIDLYAGFLAAYPRQARVWLAYGHVLRTAGRQQECVAAYRRSLELAPQTGEAWWSLANLKTVRFTSRDIEAMRAQLARPNA